MPEYAYVGLVPVEPPRPTQGGICVFVRSTRVGSGSALYWRTHFHFPDREPIIFLAEQERLNNSLPGLLADLDDALKPGRSPAKAQSDVHDIGRRFTALLLETAPGGDALDQRTALARALRDHPDQPIQVSHNLPLPLELLTLEAPVGGIAPFETMLGGRAGIHYPTSTRHGRPPGAGAAFFHDAEMSSVEDDHWRDALGQAFGLVDQHAELVVGDLAGATAELNRLYGGTSAWAHFQCHAIYSKFAKKLQLTRKFEVDEERFRGGGRYLVAVFLNCCRATELSEDVTVPPLENALRGSWSEHFSSVGLVPAVIGPFCSLEDEETVEFGRAFYKALASSEDVYDSFVAARAERLAEGHAAALVYRFLGHTSVQLPFANRQALAA